MRVRFPLIIAVFFFTGCTEMQVGSISDSTSGSATGTAENLSEHDAALRFLTAYVRLDRDLASKYATQQAIDKLSWHRSHGANIPYYDDKMILHFNGGWARVFFQETDNGYKVSDLEVHRR